MSQIRGEVPVEIRERLAEVCARLAMKYKIPKEELALFVMDIINITSDYMDMTRRG